MCLVCACVLFVCVCVCFIVSSGGGLVCVGGSGAGCQRMCE